MCFCAAGYDGEKLRVRRRDDVYMEEYSAYILVQQIQAEHQKSKQKSRKAVHGGV